MALNRDTVSSEQLGHLGLVAATIRELGIIDKIDARLDLDARKGGLVSYGRRVAAMVLNGLGFMNSRLSMTTHFFQDKPVSQLLGAEVYAENLNDDCLVLQLYFKGLSFISSIMIKFSYGLVFSPPK